MDMLQGLFYLTTALHVSDHPSSGAQNKCNYSIWQPLHRIVVCCYRGRVGTCLSVLWVAYATHNTLKSVQPLPR